MYLCEKCKTKRKSVKRLSIYKYPQVLVRVIAAAVVFLAINSSFACYHCCSLLHGSP